MKRYLFLIWFLLIPIIAQANFGESFQGDLTWVTFQSDQTVTACTLWADPTDTTTWLKSAVPMVGSGQTWMCKTTFDSLGVWLVKIRYWVGTTPHYSTGLWRVMADSTTRVGTIYTIRANAITNASIASGALDSLKFLSNYYKKLADTLLAQMVSGADLQKYVWANVDTTLPDTSKLGTWLHYNVGQVGTGATAQQVWEFNLSSTYDASADSNMAAHQLRHTAHIAAESLYNVSSDTGSFASNSIVGIKAKTDKMKFYGTAPNDSAIYSYGINASGTCPTVAEIFSDTGWLSAKAKLDATVSSRSTFNPATTRVHTYLTDSLAYVANVNVASANTNAFERGDFDYTYWSLANWNESWVSSQFQDGFLTASKFGTNAFDSTKITDSFARKVGITGTWNIPFPYSFTPGSMGDSLSNASYVQGSASGLTAQQVWEFNLSSTYDASADSNMAAHQLRHSSHILAESTMASSQTDSLMKGKLRNGGDTANFYDNIWAYATRALTDKAGFSLTQTFPTNFSSLSITSGGKVDLNLVYLDTALDNGGGTDTNFVGFLRAGIGGTGSGATAQEVWEYNLSSTFDDAGDSNQAGHQLRHSGHILAESLQTSAQNDSLMKGKLRNSGDSANYYDNFWNIAFTTAFTSGSMGDSMNNASYMQGSVSGLTAQQIWEYTTRSLTDKAGFSLATTQTFNNTGSWTGNISGSVGSVTGNVGGNVVGSVASVTGTVGSVTGNVGGSVASVTGAVGSVTGAVGSVTSAITVGTNNDKTGYGLSAQERVYLWTEDTTGLTTGWAQVFKSMNTILNKFIFDSQDSLIIDYGRIPTGGGGTSDTTSIWTMILGHRSWFADWPWNDTLISVVLRRILRADTSDFIKAGAGAGASAAEVADTLLNRGYLFGSGWQVCSLIVLDQTNSPVPNLPLQIKGWTGVAIGTRLTGTTGKASFLLDTTNYKVYVYSTVYPQVNTYDTFAVRVNHVYDTVRVTATTARLCNVYGLVANLDGTGDSGAIVMARIKKMPLKYGNVIISPYERRDTTDANGQWAMNLYPDTLLTPSGTHYEFTIFKTNGMVWKDTAVVIPDSISWQLR